MNRRVSKSEAVANALFVAGVIVVFLSPFESSGWASWTVWVGCGVALIFASHLIVPFKSQLSRYRATPMVEPTHIAHRDPPTSVNE